MLALPLRELCEHFHRGVLHVEDSSSFDGDDLRLRFPDERLNLVYGQTLLRSWAREARSALHLVRCRPNAMGSIFEPDGMHGLRRRASYRIALPFQAGKRSAFTLSGRALEGRKHNGDFWPDGWVQP